MKEALKKVVPNIIIKWVRQIKYLPILVRDNKYYNKKMLQFSGTLADNRNSAMADLMISSHVLEKGITMPERRMGFGYERVRNVINKCNSVISQYGVDAVELQSTLADLNEYLEIHCRTRYNLPDDIVSGINKLLPMLDYRDPNCYTVNREDYFKNTKDFAEFAKSRHSVRWFDDTPVDDGKLMAAIQLAQTAPSACNRQATRVKIISSPEGKKICQSLQNGNRGFGDKADKWLLITTELGDWAIQHSMSGYIDAGIFTMNLLYALHYYGIVACTLNAHLDIPHREQLQKTLGFPASELPVVFIVVGNPVEQFMIPKSRRLKVEDIVQNI